MTEPSDDEGQVAPVRQRPQRTPARRAQTTRGRPAAKAAPVVLLDDDGEPITRRSRLDGDYNDFDVPTEYKRPGWDYEWKTLEIIGQPVDSGYTIRCREAGWRQVRATDMPRLCPPGWMKPTVERGGQILMTRPKSLTDEARAEDHYLANKQRHDKLEQALATPDGHMPRVQVPLGGRVGRDGLGVQLEGEIGTYTPRQN